jgi:hypothetical protein
VPIIKSAGVLHLVSELKNQPFTTHLLFFGSSEACAPKQTAAASPSPGQPSIAHFSTPLTNQGPTADARIKTAKRSGFVSEPAIPQ